MLALITKANDDYWYKFKKVKSLKEVLKIYPRVIVERNSFTKEEVYYWDGFKKKDIPLLKKAKIHITIYNSYVE